MNILYYRAKLDYENRLLFKFAWYNDQYYLLLEVIYKHEYDKSRFLRGAKIDENKLELLRSTDEIGEQNRQELVYANPRSVHFHLLDKVISFDQEQERPFRLKPPVIIIGAAGSGKTALTLEKLKTLKGDVLYVTLSSPLKNFLKPSGSLRAGNSIFRLLKCGWNRAAVHLGSRIRISCLRSSAGFSPGRISPESI